MAEIFEYISAYGFPVVMALLLLWDRRESVDGLLSIVGDLRKTVQDNTLAVQLLIEKLEGNGK